MYSEKNFWARVPVNSFWSHHTHCIMFACKVHTWVALFTAFFVDEILQTWLFYLYSLVQFCTLYILRLWSFCCDVAGGKWWFSWWMDVFKISTLINILYTCICTHAVLTSIFPVNLLPSVLCHCWSGVRKSIWPVKGCKYLKLTVMKFWPLHLCAHGPVDAVASLSSFASLEPEWCAFLDPS